MDELRDGLLVVSKRDCPTCVMLEPVFQEILAGDQPLAIYSQDDPSFPSSVPDVVDDTSLELSFKLDIETVPTLIKVVDGREVERTVGWNRNEWIRLTGQAGLGGSLPEQRPGCGAKNVEPGIAEELALRYGDVKLSAREIELAGMEDEMEACYDRGWTDGLPVVPPTPVRVYRMLQGTSRVSNEVIGIVPPDLAECTVEKVAVNAVMAGCKPEYMPVVLAAIEAALEDEFCMHGLLATTWFSGPVVIVSGPVATRIGMNSAGNALGQGNRANATIGRALQLVIRNVGGGRPQGVDRATLGNPGKYTFCFAESVKDTSWETLLEQRGFDKDASTVTLFAGDGVTGIFDQKSRKPESLVRTYARCLRNVSSPKTAMMSDAFLVVSPEHSRVFDLAGWNKAKLLEELNKLLMIPGKELVQGAGDISEGLPAHLADSTISKFRPGGLTIVRAGGGAGMFSAIIPGWLASGPTGSSPVTKEIGE